MKIFAFVILSVGLTLMWSCNKTKTAFTHATMKPWFDTNCASCHASGKSNDNDWLYDASDYESSIKGHLSHLNSVVIVSKTMPPGSLSASELQQFSDWYAAGGAAN